MLKASFDMFESLPPELVRDLLPGKRRMFMGTSHAIRTHLRKHKPLLSLTARKGPSMQQLADDLISEMRYFDIESIQIDCRNLHLEENVVLLFDAIKRCKQLRTLTLSRNCIEHEEVEELAKVLPACTSLTHLDLSENGFEDIGDQNLAKVLPA